MAFSEYACFPDTSSQVVRVAHVVVDADVIGRRFVDLDVIDLPAVSPSACPTETHPDLLLAACSRCDVEFNQCGVVRLRTSLKAWEYFPSAWDQFTVAVVDCTVDFCNSSNVWPVHAVTRDFDQALLAVVRRTVVPAAVAGFERDANEFEGAAIDWLACLNPAVLNPSRAVVGVCSEQVRIHNQQPVVAGGGVHRAGRSAITGTARPLVVRTCRAVGRALEVQIDAFPWSARNVRTVSEGPIARFHVAIVRPNHVTIDLLVGRVFRLHAAGLSCFASCVRHQALRCNSC